MFHEIFDFALTPTVLACGAVLGFGIVNQFDTGEANRLPGLFLVACAMISMACAYDISRLMDAGAETTEGQIISGESLANQTLHNVCMGYSYSFRVKAADGSAKNFIWRRCDPLIDSDYFSGTIQPCPDAAGLEGAGCLRTYRERWAKRQIGRSASVALPRANFVTDQWSVYALSIAGQPIISRDQTRASERTTLYEFLSLAGLALIAASSWFLVPVFLARAASDAA